MDPRQVAHAARRLAAKMVADQAVPLMISFVGLEGDAGDAEQVQEQLARDDVPVIVLARGYGKERLLAWLKTATKPPSSIEVERAAGAE